MKLIYFFVSVQIEVETTATTDINRIKSLFELQAKANNLLQSASNSSTESASSNNRSAPSQTFLSKLSKFELLSRGGITEQTKNSKSCAEEFESQLSDLIHQRPRSPPGHAAVKPEKAVVAVPPPAHASSNLDKSNNSSCSSFVRTASNSASTASLCSSLGGCIRDDCDQDEDISSSLSITEDDDEDDEDLLQKKRIPHIYSDGVTNTNNISSEEQLSSFSSCWSSSTSMLKMNPASALSSSSKNKPANRSKKGKPSTCGGGKKSKKPSSVSGHQFNFEELSNLNFIDDEESNFVPLTVAAFCAPSSILSDDISARINTEVSSFLTFL